jgi:hypothetical protein
MCRECCEGVLNAVTNVGQREQGMKRAVVMHLEKPTYLEVKAIPENSQQSESH